MVKAIYPDIHIEENGSYIKLSTTLRKYHEGKWYLWRHIKSFTGITQENKAKFIIHFNKEVYNSLILGIVDPTCMLPLYYNELAYPEDSNQESEQERLMKLQPH